MEEVVIISSTNGRSQSICPNENHFPVKKTSAALKNDDVGQADKIDGKDDSYDIWFGGWALVLKQRVG